MKLTIHTDGGARNNPGPAAIGVVFVQDGKIVRRFSESIGQATNNQAEYEAVIFALEKARIFLGKTEAKKSQLEFKIDSELVVKQLNHCYRVKEEDIQRLFIRVWNLMIDFGEVSFCHVRREQNKEADKLVNEALDKKKMVQSLL